MVPDMGVLLDLRYPGLRGQHDLPDDWFRRLPKSYALTAGLMMVSFVVNDQTAQINECLKAMAMLHEEPPKAREPRVFIFKDEGPDVFVDVARLYCTCRVFNALVDYRGMCRHLMVCLARFGLAILQNPVPLLRQRGHAELLSQYPDAAHRFADRLHEVAKSGVLAMVAAFVVTGRNGAMVKQILAALDYPVPCRLEMLHGGGYGFTGRHTHMVNLGELKCTCPDYRVAGFCEGILVVILSLFLSESPVNGWR